MLQLAISTALLNLFSETISTRIFPLYGLGNYYDRWGKQLQIRRPESLGWASSLIYWAEKCFSGQSAGRNSNSSGTGSVRVSAQGLSHFWCKLSPEKPFARKYRPKVAAPGSPKMSTKLPPKSWTTSDLKISSGTRKRHFKLNDTR